MTGRGLTIRLPRASLQEMDHAVQPLIFYAADECPVPDLPRSAVYGLTRAQKWYARELGGKTFCIDEPVVFISALTRRQWECRHRVDGHTDQTAIWVDSVREAISRDAVCDDGTRIYYYITMAHGISGRALRHEFFGCGAYMSRDDAEHLLDGEPRAAGIMAHELGHCLAYPSRSLDNIEAPGRNVMSIGHRQFPDCVLNDEQRAMLAPSPFLTPIQPG